MGAGALWALAGAAITGLFTWLAQRGKNKTDQSVAVLEQWSKLNSGLATRLADVERDCAQMRRDHGDEIEKMRKDHAAEMEAMRKAHTAEVDDMRAKHRTDMRAMRLLNEGLQRQIAQNSQSTAYLVSDSPTQPSGDDES